ncbi:LLM class flavin-dependent oxidoreductase, partial [Pseudomonas aeruginosa]
PDRVRRGPLRRSRFVPGRESRWSLRQVARRGRSRHWRRRRCWSRPAPGHAAPSASRAPGKPDRARYWPRPKAPVRGRTGAAGRPISAADLPPPVANPGSRTHTDLLRRLIERETLRLDQLLLRPEVVSAAHWQVIGTVDDAVEQIVDWAAAGAMDGFIAAPGGSVGSLRLFLEQVVPRLVEKGLFRERYSATTFAGHLAEE